MDQVSAENCETKQLSELTLPIESVPQIPSLKKIDPIYSNRTMLRLIHDIALNRAFFFSFIFAKSNDTEQPGLMYHYSSQIADVASNYYLNGSGLIFSPNSSYPNFYRDFFNKTLPYFGPYAYRTDDYLDIYNPNRLPTLQTVKAIDLGADLDTSRYDRDEYFKVNEWYRLWLPDDTRDLSKTQYHIIAKYILKGYSTNNPVLNDSNQFSNLDYNSLGNSNEMDKLKYIPKMKIFEENFAFFGPPDPAENPGPVKWTYPYFDCRRSNKWIMTATSPIIDYFPRHTVWKHLRKHKYVAVSTADIDFNRIDINPCPKMRGNEEPNIFAGIARCKNTTVCEPLNGYGFRRGGYICVCKPGYRLPDWQSGAFLGEYIEKSTQQEYENGFDCIENQRIEFYPNPSSTDDATYSYINYNQEQIVNDPYSLTENRYLSKRASEDEKNTTSKSHSQHKRSKRSSYAKKSHSRTLELLASLRSINKDNCHRNKQHLNQNQISGDDMIYQAPVTFESQMRVARRTAHFLSYYLQKVDPTDVFTDRLTDQVLTIDQLYGEVLANVMSGYKIVGSGIFYDTNAFESRDGGTRPYFAPFAYKTAEDLNFMVVDKAANIFNTPPTKFRSDLNDEGAFYFDYTQNLPYFKNAKEKYGTIKGTDRLTRFTNYIHVRADKTGSNLVRYENFPDLYYAAEEGDWYGPYFNCDGVGLKTWLLTYYTPFFGMNDHSKKDYEFKGIVTIDVQLSEMDIDQCPQEYHVPNPFKGSDKCHYESQYCVFLPGKGFKIGGYKCECKQGYEYPFNLPKTYFEGDELESEYQKKMLNKSNRYDLFRCRIAGADSSKFKYLK
ncbi:unnamed protein product, partial [Gordionus sp. m RMFG-2023]